MSKGIENIIIVVILVLVTISSSVIFVAWTQNIGQGFKETAETHSESQSQKSRTSFTIVNAAGNQVGLKNTGEVGIEIDNFEFYFNDSWCSSSLYEPAGITTLQPSRIAIFTVTGFSNGYNTVRVTGPYGISDQIFVNMTFP